MSVTRFLLFTPEVEVAQPNEEEDQAAIRETFARTRAYTFERHRHAIRDAHAKSHGVLTGELAVRNDLPQELRQGLFRHETTYPVIVRLSTSPGNIVHDGVAALRGMAVKVIGVEGPKLLPEMQDAVTQDFLLCNHPTIAAGDVSSYRRQALILDRTTRVPEPLQRLSTPILRVGQATLRRFGVDRAGTAAGLAKPRTHILGETFYSQAAIRYGDYVAKVAARPASANVRALVGARVDPSNSSALLDLVRDFFSQETAEYDVQIQLATDLVTMPVEDASVEWDESVSAYRTVATLTLPPQDPYSPNRHTYADDVLSFNPWHGLVEHQPLGSIQRIRRPIYDDSTTDRHTLNAVPLTEPNSIEALPA